MCFFAQLTLPLITVFTLLLLFLIPQLMLEPAFPGTQQSQSSAKSLKDCWRAAGPLSTLESWKSGSNLGRFLLTFLLSVLAKWEEHATWLVRLRGKEWPPMGNEGLFLRLRVDCKLSPLSAAADQAGHLHLVDADYSPIHDSHVPNLILLAGRFQGGA